MCEWPIVELFEIRLRREADSPDLLVVAGEDRLLRECRCDQTILLR